MSLFVLILNKLLPLYSLIAAGFIIGRTFPVKWDAISILLIYIIAPVVIFTGVTSIELTASRLALPVVFFCLCCLVCLSSLYFTGKWLAPATRNIFAFATGSGNTGYFGLPVALYLFGQDALGLAVLAGFGFTLYENTLGFLVVARGQHTLQESIRRVLRLPTVYALLLGIIVNLSGFKIGPTFIDLGANFRGAYTVLGMMLIGLGTSQYTKVELDLRFVGSAFLMKFFVWPLAVAGLVWADSHALHMFEPSVYQIMLLMSLVPLPANSVAFAMALKTEAKQVATAVLASTLFVLLYIPLVSKWVLA